MTDHAFDSTGEAYDATQCWDDIKKGDTLIIEREAVVGLAHTWPVAVTARFGDLHTVAEASFIDEEFSTDAVRHAIQIAKERGWPLDPIFERYA